MLHDPLQQPGETCYNCNFGLLATTKIQYNLYVYIFTNSVLSERSSDFLTS